MSKTDTGEKGLETLIMRHLTGVDGLVSGMLSGVAEPATGGSGWLARLQGEITRRGDRRAAQGHQAWAVELRSVLQHANGGERQGGGALGAYEWRAVKALVESGFEPTVVTGVSIGAINAAAITGAPAGDIPSSLDALWNTITIPTVPVLPQDKQFWLSAFGAPGFYRLRNDYLNAPNWTSLCDVSPMAETLADLLDWERLNNAVQHRLCVTATNIRTRMSARFSNLKRCWPTSKRTSC